MNNVDSRVGAAAELRRKAEEIAREIEAKSPENLNDPSPEETRQTIHELRTHQIELEMQNEELRTAQAELDAARARYFDLYDLAPVGYVTVSEQGLILEANLTASTLLGVTRGALVKKPISTFILKEDQDIYYLHRKQLFETGEPQACVLRLVKNDETSFWAQLEAAVAREDNGALICRIMISDITERKQTEDFQAFLAQISNGTTEEPFFKALARYLAQNLDMDFVCIDRLEGDGLSARTVAVWCDGRFEDNVKYALKDTPCGDVVGKQVCCFPSSVCHIFPRDQVLQELRAESYIGVTLWSHIGQPIGLIAVIGRRPLIKGAHAEATLKMVAGRAAGEMERLEVEGALRESEQRLKESNEELEQRVQERTQELFQTVESLKKSRQKLLQTDKLVSLGILVAGVAHEINNPNHSIMSNVAALSGVWDNARPILDRFYGDFGDFVLGGYEYSECRDKLPEMFSNALASSKRIEMIVNELRDFARNSPREKMTGVDVNAVVNSAVVLVSNMLKDHTDRFSTELVPELPLVTGNFQRIEQVIINLIQNACQALPSRDHAVTVLSYYNEPSESVVIEVRDEGIGMPEESMNQMGTPFFTTKRASEGMGLGLSISANIAHEHGGSLTFTSKEGEGTCATLSLPTSREPNP